MCGQILNDHFHYRNYIHNYKGKDIYSKFNNCYYKEIFDIKKCGSILTKFRHTFNFMEISSHEINNSIFNNLLYSV